MRGNCHPSLGSRVVVIILGRYGHNSRAALFCCKTSLSPFGFNFLGVLIYGSIPFLKFGVRQKGFCLSFCAERVGFSIAYFDGWIVCGLDPQRAQKSCHPAQDPAQPQPVHPRLLKHLRSHLRPVKSL